MTNEELLEKMAAEVHRVWAEWMIYMFSKGAMRSTGIGDCATWVWKMDPAFHDRWTRQARTPYAKLTESEKKRDREIALRYLEIMKADV